MRSISPTFVFSDFRGKLGWQLVSPKLPIEAKSVWFGESDIRQRADPTNAENLPPPRDKSQESEKYGWPCFQVSGNERSKERGCDILGDVVANAPVAQLDRASGYEPEGRVFESLRAHHSSARTSLLVVNSFHCPFHDADIEIILQGAREQHPEARPRVISDNGPQFIARAFKEFIRIAGMTHVRTSPHYPQSNGKLERWHKSLKQECIRPGTPLSLDEAKRLIANYVEHYNNVRLHSAIGFVTPADMLAGRRDAIHAERDHNGQPLLKIPRLKEEQKVLATLSPDHVKRIIQFKPKGKNLTRAHTIAMVLLDTGLRINECLSLSIQDVDLDNLLLRVKGKGGVHRLVPFSIELRKHLFRHLKGLAVNHHSETTFATKNGTKLTTRNLQRDLKDLCRKVGIVGVRCSPHTFRHSFAVGYLKAGGNLFYLAKILGHTSTRTTERYLQSLGIEDLQKVHNQLSLLAR
jgi:integrase